MTDEELDALERLCEVVNAGPMDAADDMRWAVANVQLSVSARTAVPALVREVRRLRAANAQMRRALQKVGEDAPHWAGCSTRHTTTCDCYRVWVLAASGRSAR